MRRKLSYDVERDFAPVSLVVITSFALALHPAVPVHDVTGLIALARTQPDKLTFSSQESRRNSGRTPIVRRWHELISL